MNDEEMQQPKQDEVKQTRATVGRNARLDFSSVMNAYQQ